MATYRTGTICYIEIPASDAGKSSAFYERAFGWKLRTHGDGSIAFDDTVSQVSGMWVLNRPPAVEPGFVISIMVADARTSVQAIIAAGDDSVVSRSRWERDEHLPGGEPSRKRGTGGGNSQGDLSSLPAYV